MAAFQGRIGNLVLIILILMSAGTIIITIDRIRRYTAACKETTAFRGHVGGALRNHNLDELINIAQSHNSPGPIVLASGLIAFREARYLGFTFAIEASRRASKLSSRVVLMTMRRGMNDLAAITSTLVAVGVFGCCYGIFGGFGGCGCSLEDLHAAMAYQYSRALFPTAWSFLVAVPALWFYRYLDNQIVLFNLEMETAFLDLENYLVVHRPHG